ncbi:MAG TPA: hypothetical protein ENH10_06640, partial [Bacteroidetes bacterium]|nr:hypothetical protein [Bacteroidota bacterium]HEX04819.1 hypothetical protein [Bacteroidota bacterium]
MSPNDKPANEKVKVLDTVYHGRLQPHSLEAEQTVLGSVMIDTTAFPKVTEYLHRESFYWDKHAVIYEICEELFNSNEPIDIMTISEKLKRIEKYDEIGGDLYLEELQDATPFPSNVEFYAKVVQEKFILRTIFTTSQEAAEKVFEPDADPEIVLDQAMDKFFSIQSYKLSKSYRPVKDIALETMDELGKIAERDGELTGITSGYKKLDKLTG